MKVLLDTNIIIMAAKGELPEEAQSVICDTDNQPFYSVASYWEMVVKYASGKLALPVKPWSIVDGLKKNGYLALDISEKHVYELGNLAGIHKDPFDRIMIAQAISEKMIFLTTDRLLGGYGLNVTVVNSLATSENLKSHNSCQ
jgi:PIN domain nuclease of toxin-antitoxin system